MGVSKRQRVAVVLRNGIPVAQVYGCRMGATESGLLVGYQARRSTAHGVIRYELEDATPCRLSYDRRKWGVRNLPLAQDLTGRGTFLVRLKP